MLHTFIITAKQYNMAVSITKIKSRTITIIKKPSTWKLGNRRENDIIEQMMQSSYLGTTITSLTDEVRKQAEGDKNSGKSQRSM